MRIEDREEYIDLVAQAVIDRIEERDRLSGLVNLVVQRVVELQQQQAQAEQDQAALTHDSDGQDPNPHEERHDAGE